MRFSIDTNVLVYSVDPNDVDKRSVAKSILKHAIDLDMILTNQVIGEFLNVGHRRRSDAMSEVVALATRWAEMFPVVATTTKHIVTAARIADGRKLQFWDSVILAVVSDQETDVLLTEDMQDGQVIEGVRLLNPFALPNHALLRDLGLITPAS